MKYFPPFRFDESHGVLWRGTTEIAVTRKAADVLRCLLERAGTIVPQQTILDDVWPDTNVQPENIKVLVRELRLALGDSPHEPRFIGNEPGRGYIFVASVSNVPQLAEAPRPAAASIFINHQGDLARLRQTLTETTEAFDCRIALVAGERGTGKTALCDTFLRYAGSVPSVRVSYGQCAQHALGAEPYAPILDALDHLARQFPGTVPMVLARHAPSWLSRLPPWIADVAHVTAPPAEIESSHLIRELSAALETLGLDATTVIVLDDLHSGDLATVELLKELTRRHAPLRTMILASYAPFQRTIVSPALRSLAVGLRPTGRCISISVAPLAEDHVRAYLEARFGASPIQRLARTMHRLTGGNALLLSSAMDCLVAEDRIAIIEGTWRLRHSARTIESSLPQSLLDVILWRFQQLGSDERATLEAAAAVGVEFDAEDVAVALGGAATAATADRLDELNMRGFLHRRASGREKTVVYGFIHPAHADVIARNAPPFQQVRAAQRLAHARQEHQRFG